MIPYFPPPSWHLGAVTISGFRVAVAVALLLGYSILLWRARAVGLNEQICSRYYVICVAGGLIAGHAVYLWSSHPAAGVLDWARIWSGQSAAGLAFGGLVVLVAAYLGLRRRGIEPWPYLNALAFAFPFVWMMARAGCAMAHDHLGKPTDSVLGVRFPTGTRFDLGLVECLAAVALAGCFFAARHTRRAVFLPSLLLVAVVVRSAVWELRV